MKDYQKKFLGVVLIAVFLIPATLFAQDETKKALSVEDYARWRSIGSTAISDDGRWVTFSYAAREKDGVLFIKSLDSEKVYEIARGTSAKFSDDSKWVAYTVMPTVEKDDKKKDEESEEEEEEEDEEEAEAKKKAKEELKKRKLFLLNLESGEKSTYENATSVDFSKGSKYFVAQKSTAASTGKAKDLIFRNLVTGETQLISNVKQYALNKPGELLAYTVDVEDKSGNGVFLLFPETGIRLPLDTDQVVYDRLAWDKEGSALAVLKGEKKKENTQKDNSLLVFPDAAANNPEKVIYDPADAFDFPKEFVISEKAGLSFSKDLSIVFMGIKEQEPVPEKKEDEEEASDVMIWHWNDDRIQAVQKSQANRDRNFTYRAAFNLANKRFVRLTDEKMRSINLTEDGKWGIGSDSSEFISDWEIRKADYYLVNTATGDRKLILKEHQSTMGLSPDSKHFLYWQDHQVWDYQIVTGKKINLTEKSPVSFINKEDDHTGPKRAYGVTGWTKDEKAVILTHRYDLYLQPLDGSTATNLTNGYGNEHEIRFRYVNLDREEKFIDLEKPVLLTAYGQWTKKAGYSELVDGELEELIYVDKNIGRVTKPKKADKYFYTMQTFVDYPNYYVSDTSFSNPKCLTDANPWQSEYKWGHRILFDYTNKDGVRLQGTLAIPDDYEEGQKLPMLVNFYEKNSQNLHRYAAPRYASSPSFSGFVSNGYLVMQPDVHFNTRTPGSDMVDCVEAATRKVIEMGYADPDRIGLHGHSYSGFGAAYISTRSKMFAAIAPGAAPINLVSEFNQLFIGSGVNNHRYDIYGQGRYGVSPYEDLELYEDQSPITRVREMNTPMLYLHGTADGSVMYLQGVEWYNALRFNNKPIIFLSYPGEGHGLRKIENQKDWTKRIHQFFDHHLKGEPAPEWMIKGRTFLEKERALKTNKKEKEEDK